MGKCSARSHTWLDTREYIPERNPMDVMTQGKPLLIIHALLDTWDLTQVTDLMNSNSARKPLAEKHTSLYTREVTMGRNSECNECGNAFSKSS